jgi:hypothetical protein
MQQYLTDQVVSFEHVCSPIDTSKLLSDETIKAVTSRAFTSHSNDVHWSDGVSVVEVITPFGLAV